MKLGTPKEVALSLRTAWQVEPTSERIVEDVLALPRVLTKIIEANGCVVFDEFLRTGRRAVNTKGIELKHKPRSRQRKQTLKLPPIHPDHLEAYQMLTSDAIALHASEAETSALNEPLENIEDPEAVELGAGVLAY
jgi:hypothetical protein